MHMNAIAEPEEVSTLTEPDDSWATVVATVSRIETSLNLWLSQSHGLGLTDYRALALLSERQTESYGSQNWPSESASI